MVDPTDGMTEVYAWPFGRMGAFTAFSQDRLAEIAAETIWIANTAMIPHVRPAAMRWVASLGAAPVR